MNRPLINPLIRPWCKAPDFHPWIKFSSTVYVGKILKKKCIPLKGDEFAAGV